MFKDIINKNIKKSITQKYKKIEIKKLCLKIKIKNKIKDDKNFFDPRFKLKRKANQRIMTKIRKIIYHKIGVKIK